jgi:hypothetical protein
MKHLFFFLFLLLGLQGFAQINCQITPTDTITCFRDTCDGEEVDCIVFQVNATGIGPYTYQWYKNGSLMTGATDPGLVFPTINVQDTAYYYCRVDNGTDFCISDSGHLSIYPKVKIDTFLIDTTTIDCLENNCKGQIKLVVSGGVGPWTFTMNNYQCDPPIYQEDSRKLIRVSSGEHVLKIIDSLGCMVDTSFLVDVLKVPDVEFTSEPKDTVYLSNPYLTVSIPDTSLPHLTNWEWDFGDSSLVTKLNPAEHIYKYVREYIVQINYTAPNGCKGDWSKKIIVKTAKLTIPNIFTPDNDIGQRNETFKIVIEDNDTKNFGDAYISNELTVLDRWGRKVYSKANYRSNKDVGDWNGENLSDGTYFYILKLHGYYGDEVYKGSVTILRSH